MSKRKSRAMNPDLRWLRAANKALWMTSRRMRRATLEFLIDKWLTHGDKEPESP